YLAQKRRIRSAQEESSIWDGVEQYAYVTPVTFLASFLVATTEDLGHVEIALKKGYARLYAGMGVMTLLAIMLGIILSGGLVRPITNLDQAFGEVRDGNLAVTLPDMGSDEIGRLGATFNTMVAQLRERERMRAYVSGSVLEKVRDEHVETGQTAQFRPAAILFSDIRGFTSLSEKYPPAQIFEMLNGFLGGVEAIIREHQGDVDKFIGDAVMAVFLGDEKQIACSAVEAALDMRRFLAQFNRERQAAGSFPIEIGIGINVGNVLWGDIGSTRRKDSTVIGDEVNLASRLETASKLGRHTHIVVSESTSVLVADIVELEEMSVREVKGKEQSVRMFEVVACRPAPRHSSSG
ncbi:MAG TPA: adenylate/guanylate cyclase domain-containing protein, partial [Candidatus Ozemobacteraceae bacterium]|nr:adenylate/guanylate cyclase domain-containing protein [Candidatus Ozemobacteraceae bacterium]